MNLTQAKVRRLFEYNPMTGVLTWKIKYSRKVVVGTAAGGLDVLGYVVIGIDGEKQYAHRVIWLWMTGNVPKKVDHKDTVKSNNVWGNLRIATQSQNAMNAKLSVSNTSGYKGVYFHKGAQKWCAFIGLNGRSCYLGLFETAAEAHSAYMAAATAAQPEFARAS